MQLLMFIIAGGPQHGVASNALNGSQCRRLHEQHVRYSRSPPKSDFGRWLPQSEQYFVGSPSSVVTDTLAFFASLLRRRRSEHNMHCESVSEAYSSEVLTTLQ